MKKHRYEKRFLVELESNPNIALACKRVGLSRQSVYRWCREDADFSEKVAVAMHLGVESILDMAESKLLSNASAGNQRAVEKTLDYYGKRSERNRPKAPVDDPYRGKTLADIIAKASQFRRERDNVTSKNEP